MSNNHVVTTYEPLNMTPAPANLHAVFLLDDGTKDYKPVFAFAVANVFEQKFNEKGQAQTSKDLKQTAIVGLSIHGTESEPMVAHDMICEDVPNFRGYVYRAP